ncbi:MAG: ABC transporter ATP-binding protein [Defluviitaleaceae bacterium]|nr:ABC transporter ATP-binding protein [Defluviitaleaceae bacterium]
MVVRTENLTKIYKTGETEVRALVSANVTISRGEAVAIIGASGSGKSTMLHLMGGIDRPTDGKVFIENEDIYSHGDETLALLRRRRIGFVFQMYNLMPQLTVYENVVLPLGLDGRIVDRPRVEALLESLGLAEKHKSLPNRLSGGQQQRVAIARALVTQPAILLADEPTGNLDSKTGADVLNLLRSTAQRLGQTMAVITHDEKVAQFCDRVLRIEDGAVREG